MENQNAKPVSMGFKLFPPPPKQNNPSNTPLRKPSLRRQAVNGESAGGIERERSESPAFQYHSDGRQSAMDGSQVGLLAQGPSGDGRESSLGGRQTPQGGRQTPQPYPQNGRSSPSPIAVPPAAFYQGQEQPRSHTSFSEAPTLVRSNSNGSHNSTAKNGLHNPSSPPRGEPSVARSIFPRYNPEIPLEHQPYFPTQASPTHIPRSAINRSPYSPNFPDGRSPLQSPGITLHSAGNAGKFPRGISDDAPTEASSNEELRELWKVVSGWRVQQSEGRIFVLKMSSNPEEPVHTLSSATQPFYTLRLDPTSTSAQMTMTRLDPSTTKTSSLTTKLTTGSAKPEAIEVMGTTLEEAARRLPPNDGLVALLYPRAASNMVIELANKPPNQQRQDTEAVMQAAERECGRLVWDEDSKRYYLVHPALPTPFVVSISSSPAWSKVEYVLEHESLPRNIVRLVRDGAGGGFLEVDTGVAAKIDCFYIVDVAICAILLVALADEKVKNIERFDAPPLSPPSLPSPNPRTSRFSRKSKKEDKDKRSSKMEEFELDLESQEYAMSPKEGKEKKEEKVPGFCGLLWMLVKCFAWVFVLFFKGIAKCVVLLGRCCVKRKS
jgi:hypothetical protein